MASAAQKPAPVLPAPARKVEPPRLLIDWEPWPREIARRVRESLAPPPAPLRLTSHPAPFWKDVFVPGGRPRRGLAISLLYHSAALAFLYLVPTLLLLAHGLPRPLPPIERSDLIYYHVSAYLPPLHAPAARAARPQSRPAQPRLAPQRIISIPLRPDNREQTIVNPSSVHLLLRPLQLPNLVVSTPILAPPAAIPGPLQRLIFPLARVQVIPPPAAVSAAQQSTLKLPAMPSPSAIPPPLTPDQIPRRPGQINMAESAEVVPPKLPVTPERATGAPEDSASPAAAPSAAPAAPVITGGSATRAAGQLLALNLVPAVPEGPIAAPNGYRNGEFAVGPEGTPDAPGTPALAAGAETVGAAAAGKPGGGEAGSPVDITVGSAPGASPKSSSPNGAVAQAAAPRPALVATAIPPRLPLSPRETSTPAEGESVEEAVFGGKKYYSLTLNMPNLTSAGGSWVIRFARLDGKLAPGQLSAPVAVEKVDPAYPPDVMRDHVEGTVTLYAVIASNGSVRDVRVLESLDQRLDRSARIALLQWRFHPGTLNGVPVDLEAVVRIPFKLRRASF